MPVGDGDIFNLVKEEGLGRLVAAFYRRVRLDDVLAPLYPQADFDGAEQRLRDFLIQRFGGPTRYSDVRGHPRLRMRHAPFRIDERARDRWVQLMDGAVEEAELPADVLPVLRAYLHDTATFMKNALPSEGAKSRKPC